MTPSIFFHFQGQAHEIRLAWEQAPHTLERLLASLPASIDIHCAKIAGRHIFWHAPFVAPLEQAQDVLSVPPGTFLYWPERQFLELIYGELQAESAKVTVLGHLEGDVAWLSALGEQVRLRQGHEVLWASLSAGSGAGLGTAPLPVSAATAVSMSSSGSLGAEDARFTALRQARIDAWQAEPDCLRRLAARRGILLPYGPLAMAEGEFRKLQELLWRLGTPLAHDIAPAERGRYAAFLIDAFLTRIVGLCGLDESGEVLAPAAALLRDRPDQAPVILEEVILYCGRMAAWLDLYIPWHTLNEQLVGARDAA